MNLKILNYWLAGAMGVFVLAAATFHVDSTKPNVEFVPMMRRSAAYDAFSPNPNFKDGQTLQRTVPGTIARGELPLYYEATKEDAERAGRELLNPYASATADETSDDESAKAAADAASRLNASIQRGADRYNIYCLSCHGPSGAGDGPVAKRGFPPPPSLTAGKSLQMKDGQLFHIVTYGQGSMASMAAQVSRAQRWDVVNYIRSMQESAKQKLEADKAAAPVPATSKSDDNDEAKP